MRKHAKKLNKNDFYLLLKILVSILSNID